MNDDHASLTDVRHVKLSNGTTLELAMSHEFVALIRHRMSLPPEQDLSDEHVRCFMEAVIRNAASKLPSTSE